MRIGTAQVREILGPGGVTDQQIQDSLWYSYYDVEKTVDYLLKKMGVGDGGEKKAKKVKKIGGFDF
jgi:hypothetical protein